MESNKDKKIAHLLENINEKLEEVSGRIDSEPLKKELNEYKKRFAEAEARYRNGYHFK